MASPAQETAEPTRTGQAAGPTTVESSTPRQDADMTTSSEPVPAVVTQADDGRLINLTGRCGGALTVGEFVGVGSAGG
jgi:hypothetical protein